MSEQIEYVQNTLKNEEAVLKVGVPLVKDDIEMCDSNNENGKAEEAIKLLHDGSADDDDDDTEDSIIMTGEEVRSYLLQQIGDYMKDPEMNPLLSLRKKAQDLQEKIRERKEDFERLNKTFEIMHRDQEKFFRHIGLLPKVPMRSVQVSVDLPVLPNSLQLFDDSSQVMHFRIDPSAPKIGNVTKISANTTTITGVSEKTFSTKSASNEPICIDLTDESDSASSNSNSRPCNISRSCQHPAPLPDIPVAKKNKLLPLHPCKPRLKISADKSGIILQWDMPPNVVCAKLSSFEIFGYQEQTSVQVSSILWKKVGSVKAMNLPMACTLAHFVEGFRYHFSIRAIDIYGQFGSFSDPASILFEFQGSSKRKVKTEHNV